MSNGSTFEPTKSILLLDFGQIDNQLVLTLIQNAPELSSPMNINMLGYHIKKFKFKNKPYILLNETGAASGLLTVINANDIIGENNSDCKKMLFIEVRQLNVI